MTLVLVDDEFRSLAHMGYALVSAWDQPRFANVCVHELGHAIGLLLDEYSEEDLKGWDYLVRGLDESIENWGGWGANVTTRTRRDEIPWRAWLGPDVPVPTPTSGAWTRYPLGLYKGAVRYDRGWFRPSPTCCMRDESQPFCVVCREALVRRISQRTFPLRVSKVPVDRDTWRFTLLSIIPERATFTWRRNGFPVGRGPVFEARRDDCPWGESELVCEIHDDTDWVRSDPHDWTRFTLRFQLDKGWAWDHGLKVKGPWRDTPEEIDGEEIMRRFD